MFLLSEEELMEELGIYQEGVSIKWDVFSRFMQSPEETEELMTELRKANSLYRELSDEKLYKDRSGVAKVITNIFRFLLDFEGAGDIILAPFTLGLSLITYLLTRLLNHPVDAIERKYWEKEADKAIDKLKQLKKKYPKKASEIDSHIKRIQNNLDDH